MYSRPILKEIPGPIGGHCVVPNLKILDSNRIVRFILDINDELEGNQGES